MPLHTKIFLGLLLGALFGALAQWAFLSESPAFADTLSKEDAKKVIDEYLVPIGRVFLWLIFMIVVPLLFSALVLGVAEVGRAGKVGRIGFRALLLTVLLSAIAVVLGLAAVNLVKPGERIDPERRAELRARFSDPESKEAGQKQLDAATKTAEDPPLLGFIPRNPLKEANRALEGGLLPFMFFALIFGIALSAIPYETALPVSSFLEGIFAMSLKIIEWAMAIAPIGVFFLIFGMVATLGWSLLASVLTYAILVLVVLAIHQFVVYPIFLRVVAKRNPLEFFRQIKTVMLTAFATSSSNATLPVALKAADEEVGLPRDVSSFVLTVGATANQNGTALFEGITILFLAQLYGVDLTIVQQLTVMGLAIVAGIGTAGVPGGSLPFIAALLARFEIPTESIAIIIGIDRILDMSRTVLNVTGDLTIAACVSAMEGRKQAPVAELAET